MKKNIKKISVMMLLLGASISSQAQTWNLGGNTRSNATEDLGTSSPTDLKFITDGQFRMSLTQQGRLGLGIDQPRAWQEINYCPPPGQSENGLIVTLNNCQQQSHSFLNVSDVIGGGIIFNPSGEGNTFSAPLNFLTGNITNVAFPLLNNEAPLFWVRQEFPQGKYAQNSGLPEYETNFVVMPDGSCGVNIAQPRAAMDIRGSNKSDYPAAIIGARVPGYNLPNSNGLVQYHTQQVQFVPLLSHNGYNQISHGGDQGMFFTDGKGVTASSTNDGSNLDGAFVLAPWASQGNSDIGGMRMEANGDTEFHGTLRATKMNVDAKWWSDFVFDKEYKLPSLTEVEAYIAENKHLPDVPSEAEVLENGLDLGEMQAIQQQKIEELTLYTIDQEKRIAAQQKRLEELEALIDQITKR
jgi:hypothetical protein